MTRAGEKRCLTQYSSTQTVDEHFSSATHQARNTLSSGTVRRHSAASRIASCWPSSTRRQTEVAPNNIASLYCPLPSGYELSTIFLDLGHSFCLHSLQIIDDDVVIGDQGLNVGFRLASDGDAQYRVVEGRQLSCVGVTRTDCLCDRGRACDLGSPREVRGLGDRGGRQVLLRRLCRGHRRG